jgi:hypothetical protein
MTDTCIVEKCAESWDETTSAGLINKNNCSGFLKGVAARLGISMPAGANADGLVDFMTGQKWKVLATGAEAALQAGNGMFVVAGLKSGAHSPARSNGHVGVVVSGTLYRGIYPKCWCGSIGSAQSKGTKSVGEIWSRSDRDAVVYYMYATQICKQT